MCHGSVSHNCIGISPELGQATYRGRLKEENMICFATKIGNRYLKAIIGAVILILTQLCRNTVLLKLMP